MQKICLFFSCEKYVGTVLLNAKKILPIELKTKEIIMVLQVLRLRQARKYKIRTVQMYLQKKTILILHA